MKPTVKDPQIESLLTAITGKDRRHTVITKGCVWCNMPNLAFRDRLSRKEYAISGMCQNCQDDVFGE